MGNLARLDHHRILFAPDNGFAYSVVRLTSADHLKEATKSALADIESRLKNQHLRAEIFIEGPVTLPTA